MQRVAVFGRGGAGKSTLCRQLGEVAGLPVVELDAVYWDAELRVLSAEEWSARQADLVRRDAWILDGDLGPYDVRRPRLERADTVVIVDTHVARCVLRALLRGQRRRDFWEWTLSWGRVYRPATMADVRQWAPHAELVVLRNPRQVAAWLDQVVGKGSVNT